jgi:hypothetical protein
MKTLTSAKTLLVGLFVLGMFAFPISTNADPPPEMKVLERYVGTWKKDDTIKIADGPEITSTGFATHKLVLGGRFLESTSVSNPGEHQVLQLSIYDDKQRIYRSWYFDSNGQTSEWKGTWDNDSKTWTQTANLGHGHTATSTFRFVDDATIASSLTGRRSDGKVSVEIRGTFTRQEDAKPVVCQESNERSSNPPELKVLEKLVGKWTIEGVNKVAVWTPEEVRFETTSNLVWILNGKCVLEAKPDAMLIHTFSENEKAYKFWHFNANGYVHEWTGEWDENTQTFTWKTDLDGSEILSSVLTQVFSDDDSSEWSAIATDKQGKVYHHIEGKSRRRK